MSLRWKVALAMAVIAAVTAITQRAQVRTVWMEGSDDHFYPIGRWHVEDELGTLTLVLDENPPEAGRVLRIESLRAHEELDCGDYDDVTTLDRQWILAKAATILLLEADPSVEDASYLAAEIQRWDMVRQGREAELRGRRQRTPGKLRSRSW